MNKKEEYAKTVIKELLVAFKQPQGWLADQIGMSRGHLNRIINGKAIADLETDVKVARFLSMTRMLAWIAENSTEEEMLRFRDLLSQSPIKDPYIKTVFCASNAMGYGRCWWGSIFNPPALHDNQTSPEEMLDWILGDER